MMNEKRFEELLYIHGSDIERWGNESQAAQELLQQSPAAQELHARARAADAALLALEVPPMRENAQQTIMHKIAQLQANEVQHSSFWFSWRKRFVIPGVATTLAAVLLYVGAATLQQPPQTEAEYADSATVSVAQKTELAQLKKTGAAILRGDAEEDYIAPVGSVQLTRESDAPPIGPITLAQAELREAASSMRAAPEMTPQQKPDAAAPAPISAPKNLDLQLYDMHLEAIEEEALFGLL